VGESELRLRSESLPNHASSSVWLADPVVAVHDLSRRQVPSEEYAGVLLIPIILNLLVFILIVLLFDGIVWLITRKLKTMTRRSGRPDDAGA
jgi:hypothetical protein